LPSVKLKRTSKNGGIAGLKIRSGKLNGIGVYVGHDGSSGKYPGKNGPSVASVGKWNSEGTDRIPKRDYLAALVKQYAKKYRKVMGAMSKNFLAGRLDRAKANRNMGIRGVREFKAIITAWRLPRNAASTIQRKGFDDPLIHTKRLLRSVMWKDK